MTAVNSIVTVVRTHDAGCPRVHTIFEMRQIYFLFCTLVTGNTAFKTRILHIIEGIMLHTGHDVLILNASDQCRAHLSDLISLFPVSLLASSPPRIVRHVNTYTGKKIAAESPDFLTDTVAYSLL